MNRAVLKEFLDQGVGKSLKPIDIPEIRTVTAQGIWLFNKAPHPNAARVFINWFLTKEGQKAWTHTGSLGNSRRTDVEPVDITEFPNPNREYLWLSDEENIPRQNEVREYLEDLLK